MFNLAQPPEASGVVGQLSLPALIECLKERIAVMRQVGTRVEVGSLADLLEEAVRHLQGIDARAVRAVAEARRDYGGQ